MVVFPDVWRTAPADVVLYSAVSEAERQGPLGGASFLFRARGRTSSQSER